jgi:hypothetical protein
MTWEEFVYELSALGFVYSKEDRSWRREDGAMASDEALRDIHTHWPVLMSAALQLYAEGAKTISVEFNRDGQDFVTRLRTVE